MVLKVCLIVIVNIVSFIILYCFGGSVFFENYFDKCLWDLE